MELTLTAGWWENFLAKVTCPYNTGQQALVHEAKCLFFKYFWTLNSNMFPEFLYYTHICSMLKGWNLLRQDTCVFLLWAP